MSKEAAAPDAPSSASSSQLSPTDGRLVLPNCTSTSSSRPMENTKTSSISMESMDKMLSKPRRQESMETIDLQAKEVWLSIKSKRELEKTAHRTSSFIEPARKRMYQCMEECRTVPWSNKTI